MLASLARAVRAGALAGVGARGMAGVRRRARALREAGLAGPGAGRSEGEGELERLLEDSEPDPQRIHHVYADSERESQAHQELISYNIVHRKYFKEQHPNLLTWSEKEQIRYLGTEQADEWPPERLAESFPVTPAVVKKLINFPWKPSTEARIARHDASAMRNWKELKEGTLNIPQELREHFLKFSDRKIPPLKKSSIIVEGPTPEQIGEFQAIIEECASKQKEKESRRAELPEPEIREFKTKPHAKRLTLDQLKESINTNIERGKRVELSDKIILHSFEAENPVNPVDISKEIEVFKEDTKAVAEFEEKTDVAPADYPIKIKIPKSAWKKGATFKVNDCYYDYDGEFLYRVPGLFGKV